PRVGEPAGQLHETLPAPVTTLHEKQLLLRQQLLVVIVGARSRGEIPLRGGEIGPQRVEPDPLPNKALPRENRLGPFLGQPLLPGPGEPGQEPRQPALQALDVPPLLGQPPLQLGHEIADLPDLLPDSGTARRQMIEPPDTFARLRQPAVELFEWVHTSPTNERPGRVPHPRRTVGGHSTNRVTIPGSLVEIPGSSTLLDCPARPFAHPLPRASLDPVSPPVHKGPRCRSDAFPGGQPGCARRLSPHVSQLDT